MTKEFFQGNRARLYAQMKESSLLVLFSGTEVRKTNDEFYPFYTNRNFLYLTGVDQKETASSPARTARARSRRRFTFSPLTGWQSAGPESV